MNSYCSICIDTVLDLALSVPLSACECAVQPKEDKRELSDCLCTNEGNEMTHCAEALLWQNHAKVQKIN